MTLSSKQQAGVEGLAEIALAGTYSGLDARLREITFSWDTNGLKAEGTFCYLAFRDGQMTQDDFVTFVYHKIVPFCLPRQKIRWYWEQLTETHDERFLHEPVDKAKELFLKAKKKNAKSGEPAEIVLFALLEGLNKAPRLVAKMQLKTNSNMEVHGSDAIHMKYDPDSSTLTVYWGEAKLYNDLSGALEEIVKSVHSFRTYDPEKGHVQRDLDIDIIEAHADIEMPNSEETREALAAHFDPYTNQSNKLREIHACLAMWDWDMCKKVGGLEPDRAEDVFREKYLERVQSACELFREKVREQDLLSLRFHFFLLPIVDVQEFRERFCQKVGLPYPAPEGK